MSKLKDSNRNVATTEDCINLCHVSPGCAGYEHYSARHPDLWRRQLCSLKARVDTFTAAAAVTSGYSFYVCPRAVFADQEAIGQNIGASEANSFKSDHVDVGSKEYIFRPIPVKTVPLCVKPPRAAWGFPSLASDVISSPVSSTCSTRPAATRSSCATDPPPTSTCPSAERMSWVGPDAELLLHCVILILPVSESPILSMVMTQNSSAECEMLASNQSEPGHPARGRSRRAAGEAEDGGDTADTADTGDASMPNIDFLLNPGKKEKREDYEGYVMKRLLSFFEERNSSMLYPNLFR